MKELLSGDVVDAAAGLIGCEIVRRIDGGRIVRAVVVEAEAYHQREPGCHAYRGMTERNRVMFGVPGLLYVYFTYGMWHCANVVCESEGTAAAVLLRSASHQVGDGGEKLRLGGPGLLCKGLEIDRTHNGLNLFDRRSRVWIHRPDGWVQPELTWTTRIGFSFPDPLKWRCYWTGHPDVSKARTGVLRRNHRRD